MSIHYDKDKHSDVVNETIHIWQVLKISKEDNADETDVPIDSIEDNIIDWIVDAYRKDPNSINIFDAIEYIINEKTGERDYDAYAFTAQCDCKEDERYYYLVYFDIHVDGSGCCSGFLPNGEAGAPTDPDDLPTSPLWFYMH